MTGFTTKALPNRRQQRQTGPGRLIVGLAFARGIRPAWVGPDERLHVPIPPGRPADLPGDRTLVWAVIESNNCLPLIAKGQTGLEFAYPWPDWQSHILAERYATWRRRPLHTRSPVSYRAVPPKIRHILAQHMCKGREKQDRSAFPAIPFDSGFEALRDVIKRHAPSVINESPWPRICLTHDIDTAGGFGFVRQIAEIESAAGLRSCWNIVPFGYRVDTALCDWLIERGHEIGLHGHCHDNRLIYLPESRLRRRLDACRDFIDRYGVRGFRSPSWLRNSQLMRVLPDYVDYDCSCLDFDWICPAGRGGVLTATPFHIGSLIEIPTTIPFEMPQLFGVSPARTIDYWRPKIDWLRNVGGQVIVNSHPDPDYLGQASMMRAYEQCLAELVTAFDNRWSLPRELADDMNPKK